MNKNIKAISVATVLLLTSQFTVAGGNVPAGKTKSAPCTACHGLDGNSQAPTFPKLAGLGEKYLVKQMTDIKSGNRKVIEMTGMLDALSNQDLSDIAAYFTSNSIKVSVARTKDIELGKKVYRAGIAERGVPACFGCHSPTGSGNSPAGYPAIGGQFAPYLAKQLRAFRIGADDPDNKDARNNDGETRIMREVAAHLSDREIEAVSNYISGLH